MNCRRTFPWIYLSMHLLFPVTIMGTLVGTIMGTVFADEALQPLRYNNPGLVVDLGVGLWAWPVPWDVDQDGDYDLLVSCPDKPSNGVWFFENRQGDTRDNALPIFEPARKLSSTVHYVMPSYVDGKLRVLSPGKEYNRFHEIGTREPTPLPIPANFYKPRWETNKGPRIRHNQWRYVDYNQDSKTDLVVAVEDWSEYGWDDAWDANGHWQRGPLHGFIFIFENEGTNEVPAYKAPIQVMSDGKELDVYGCPSPNFGDFDGDGDLDLICGEFIDGFTYFENQGSSSSPEYATGKTLETVDGLPLKMELQMIVPVAFDWDRDGDLDLIVGDEDGRVAFVENAGGSSPGQPPRFKAPAYFQQKADELKCGALATPYAVDWDGDGDQDILSGNTAGFIEWFENQSGPGVEFPVWNAPVRLEVDGKPFRVMAGPNGSIQGPAEAKWGYTTLSAEDWNQDGLPDILLNSIWGEVLWLENIGTRKQPQLASPQPIEVSWTSSLQTPKPSWTWWNPAPGTLATQWRTTPLVFDWNQDSLVDLVMLDHEGYLCLFPRMLSDGQMKLGPPQRLFQGTNFAETDSQHRGPIGGEAGVVRLNRSAAGGSGRRKIAITDWDQDGKPDFLVNSTNANFLKNLGEKNGQWLLEDCGPLVSQSIQGHTTSPCTVDFNNDGIPDFLGGAENGRFYYLRNPLSATRSSINNP